MIRRIAALVAVLLLVTMVAASADTTIKLATLVPNGSLWDKELRAMGNEWRQATDGRVKLTLYAGGVAGGDADVVRKMRIGQLHAATLTVVGLSEIDEGFEVFNVPGFYRSYEELYSVVQTLTPNFERRLDEKGYVLLGWGHGGWIHLFSKKAVATPSDVQKLKLFTVAGNNRMTQWWKGNGYRPVPLSMTDIMTGLKTGLIEAVPTTPLAALTFQYYRNTPYMLDVGFSPLVGATVISKRTWKRISEDDRVALKKAAKELERRLEIAVPDQDRRAVVEMESRGLKVTHPDDEAGQAAWDEEARRFGETMRQRIVPNDVYRRAEMARESYRKSAGGG